MITNSEKEHQIQMEHSHQLSVAYEPIKLNQYFEPKKKKAIKRAQSTAMKHVEDTIDKVTNLIENGQEQLGYQSKQIYQLLRPLKSQETKVLSQRQQIEQQLEYLDRQLNGNKCKQDEKQIYQTYVLSKQEHEEKVKRIIVERKQKEKKHEKLVKFRTKKQKQLKQLQHKAQIEKGQNKKQNKRHEIQENLEKQRQVHEKILQQQKYSNEKYKQMKSKKFLHEVIEERYHSDIELPMLDNKKQKLKQIRQIRKAYDIENIKQHEKKYLDQRAQSIASRPQLKNQWNYKPPAKTERLIALLEQQKISQRIQMQEKKRAYDQMKNRQQNFLAYLKENFKKLSVNNQKRKLDNNDVKGGKTQPRKPKLDGKVLGIHYLEELKQMKKKKKKKPEQETEKQQTASNKSRIIDKPKTKTNYQYIRSKVSIERQRRKKLQQLLHSDLSSEQKLMQLQIEDDKIRRNVQEKQSMLKYGYSYRIQDETVQMLLRSIQTKLGIIQVYKDHQTQVQSKK